MTINTHRHPFQVSPRLRIRVPWRRNHLRNHLLLRRPYLRYILSSIFSLVAYVGPYFSFALLGIAVAVASSFALTFLFTNKKQAA